MHRMTGTEVELSRDVKTIIIPEGTEGSLPKGERVFIQQVLGGMFTIQSANGYLMRIDGCDADALGQPIPEERRRLSPEEVLAKGMKETVLEQLKTCYDPEIPVNIVDLGLIYEQEIKELHPGHFALRIEMTLTAPGCGMGEILKSDVEKKLKDIPGVEAVLVDLVFEPPWESSLMSESAKLHLGFL